MSRPVWYKSLYWRIAFGFIALLAVVLAAQVVIFLWLTDRIVGPSSRSPQQLANSVAAEVSKDLAIEPDLRLDPYLRSRFGHIYQPFLVVLNDGRFGSNRGEGLPGGFMRSVVPRMRRFGGRFGGPGDPWRGDGRGSEPGRGAEPGRGGNETGSVPDKGPGGDSARGPGPGPWQGPPPPMGDGRGPKPSDMRPGDRPPDGDMRGPRRAETAEITVNGTEMGTVYVPAEAPPVFVAVWQVGPTLAWFALGMLGVGAAVTALAIFRPTHNRLHALEEAATALGQGRTDVRAMESGGDEVSSLARTFNRMARDLEARAKALGASDRARRQLLADVSHELMTPLTAIRGYTETLSMHDLGIDEPTRLRYLGIIGEETHKLEVLIGDLLDLARLEGGGGTLAFKDVTIADLFGRIEDRHRPAVLEGQITLTASVEPPELAVWGDAHRLEQALQNLAANAIRHTPEGGTVALRASRQDDGIHITVADSGAGIPPEHLPRIFDRFYKVDPSRSATFTAGSGLGLSIVQAIVERHGGKVSASNADHGGALFEVVLPARAADRAA